MLKIISYACALGANDKGSEQAPKVIHELMSKQHNGMLVDWLPEIKPSKDDQKLKAVDEITKLCTQVGNQTFEAVSHKNKFLVLGGDHSCAIGTWSGVKMALQKDHHEVGLVWIDAHMDAHTHKTSHTKNVHGMPVAALLGHGDPKLSQLMIHTQKVKPENMVLIGIRDYEKEEKALLKDLGIQVYYMQDLKEKPLTDIVKEAIHKVTKHGNCLGLSLDIDAVDPKDAPGVNTKAENGILAKELMQIMPLFAASKSFVGADIVEFNPHHDTKDHKTAQLILNIIDVLYKKQPHDGKHPDHHHSQHGGHSQHK